MDCSVLLFLGIYTPLEARVYVSHQMMLHRYGNFICTCLLHFWVPSSCFCIKIGLPGWNNPVQRCLPVGGGCIIHAGGGGGHALTGMTALMCNRRRPAATSSRRASFSALASANSFVYFASSAATSRWRIPCQQLPCLPASASAFLSRWAL